LHGFHGVVSSGLIDKDASAVIRSALGLENARFDNGASIIVTEYHAIGADNGARYRHGQIRMIGAWCAPNGFIVCHVFPLVLR
jgi:hypothetical protein